MKEDLSIEQILKSIKQVILGRNHDSIKSIKPSEKNAQYQEDDDEAYELTDLAPENLQSLAKPQEYMKEEQGAEAGSLLSQKTAKEAMQYFSSIKENVGKNQQNNTNKNQQTTKTVEDLTVEIMKPYLSKWLDENLPRIVKGLVEQEIKKLVSDENNISRNN